MKTMNRDFQIYKNIEKRQKAFTYKRIKIQSLILHRRARKMKRINIRKSA